MANKQQYLDWLRGELQKRYKCGVTHRRTVPVHEVYKGKTVWKGEVEVFWLTGHSQAKRCYAWSDPAESGNQPSQFVAVLEVPPVIGPATAVKAALALDAQPGQ